MTEYTFPFGVPVNGDMPLHVDPEAQFERLSISVQAGANQLAHIRSHIEEQTKDLKRIADALERLASK